MSLWNEVFGDDDEDDEEKIWAKEERKRQEYEDMVADLAENEEEFDD